MEHIIIHVLCGVFCGLVIVAGALTIILSEKDLKTYRERSEDLWTQVRDLRSIGDKVEDELRAEKECSEQALKQWAKSERLLVASNALCEDRFREVADLKGIMARQEREINKLQGRLLKLKYIEIERQAKE